MMHLTWNYWTFRVKAEPAGATGSDGKESFAQEVPPSVWELRPEWQRAALCLFEMGVGVFFIGMYTTLRTRTIRTLLILPPTTAPAPGAGKEIRRVFIQCAHHKPEYGHIYPMAVTSIPASEGALDPLLRIEGIRGSLAMKLDRVRINGEPMSNDGVKNRLLTQWWGSKKLAAAQTSSRWASGPLANR
jgi:hypothetical protein